MRWLRTRIGWLLVVASVLVAGMAVLLLAGQGMLWLQHGVWPQLSVRMALANPDVRLDWVGAQQIAEIVLAYPIAGVLALIGIGAGVLGLKMAVVD
jgi:hypothetical protein